VHVCQGSPDPAPRHDALDVGGAASSASACSGAAASSTFGTAPDILGVATAASRR
jgi:hypothetical protein